jgi:8-oxo-dGTP pyrophosphatase MutT (NUDIX family)
MAETERPRAVVGVLMYRANGDVLLIRSHKWSNRWVVPGGHIEYGERMEDAVRREMAEETGIEVTEVQFVTASEGIFPPEFHERRHFIYLHFTAFAPNDTVALNDEAEEYRWVKPEEALSMDLVKTVSQFIERYLQMKLTSSHT